MTRNEETAKLMIVLSRHVGRENSIGADALYERVYEIPAKDKINATRALRKLVTDARTEGVPIASRSDSDGGGYYLARAGLELTDYLNRLRRRGLNALLLEARIRQIALDELLGQIQLNLRGAA